MVAVAAREAEAFVKSGFGAFRLILVFGPDDGLVGERAAAIAAATAAGDAGNIMRLDGDEIAGDALRLADEANAISMFGGERAIRVRLGSRSIVPALEPLFAAPPIDSRVIVEAGDLKPNHAVRSLFEKSKTAAAVPCYAEDARDIGRWVDAAAAARNLSFAPDARAALLDSIGQDRAVSRSETEKLFLYCAGQRTIGLEDVEAVVTDAAALSADTVIDAAFLGRTQEIDGEARRILADGVPAGVLLSLALRHALTLRLIAQDIDGGRNANESIKAHRIHWRREKAVQEQMQRWLVSRLDRAVQIIAEAALAARKSAALGDEIAIRAFWSLALASGRR